MSTDSHALTLFAGDTTQLPAVQEYVTLMHLPPEATASVLLAMQIHQELRRRCTAQWALLKVPGEAAKLITSRDPLNAWQVAQTGLFARSVSLPLDCIYAMAGSGKNAKFMNGILSGGYRLKAQADPRILKSASTIQVESGVMETSKLIPGSSTGAKLTVSVPWVRVVYRVTFWNGDEYVGVGMADGSDKAIEIRGTSQMPAIAETRAANRAYRSALRMVSGNDEAGEEGEEDA